MATLDFFSILLDTIKSINQELRQAMATAADFQAIIDKLKADVQAVIDLIAALKAQIAAGGLSAMDEQAVLDQLTAVETGLAGITAPPTP